MKTVFACALAVVLSASAALPRLAAASTWDGTWKLNQKRSQLLGDTFTVTQQGSLYHYASGSTVSYDYACDGKPYPTFADRTIACTEDGAGGFDIVAMAGKTALSRSHRTLSSDNQILSIKGTQIHPDGTSSTFDVAYQRVTGTTGLAGKWVEIKDNNSADAILIMTVGGGSFRIEYPAYKEVVAGKTDGSDSPVTGPTIPAGATETFTIAGPNKLRFTIKFKDKVLDEGMQMLSADGKTLTVEEWEPGKMSEKATLVYERQ